MAQRRSRRGEARQGRRFNNLDHIRRVGGNNWGKKRPGGVGCPPWGGQGRGTEPPKVGNAEKYLESRRIHFPSWGPALPCPAPGGREWTLGSSWGAPVAKENSSSGTSAPLTPTSALATEPLACERGPGLHATCAHTRPPSPHTHKTYAHARAHTTHTHAHPPSGGLLH